MSVKVTGDHRICFIGDSLVFGTGDSECLGWGGRMAVKAQNVGWNVIHYNFGIRGDTSRDIPARWNDEAERRFPADTEHFVVFSFGVNDTMMEGGFRRVSLRESRESFQRILGQSQAQYPTLMIGPPPVCEPAHNSRIQELSQSLDALAQKTGCCLFKGVRNASARCHLDERGE